MMKTDRSLYSCMNAHYPTNGGIRLCCKKNHILPISANVMAFKRGAPLICKVCANCPDFDDADKPLNGCNSPKDSE